MKNKINLITIFLLSIGCTVSNNTTIPEPSFSSSPSSTVSPSISISPSIIPTPEVLPSNLPEKEDLFKLKLEGNGYIYSPETSYLTINPLDISLSLYLNKLKDENSCIFEIYDNKYKKTYLSLSIDKNKNFIINLLGNEEKTSLNSIELNKKIDIRLFKDNKKLKFYINNTILLEKDFNIIDDKEKKILFIGANHEEKNKIEAEYNYFSIKDIILYNFHKNLLDESIYKLNAISKGNYKLLPIEEIPSLPSVTPTPSATPTPIIERNDVSSIKNSKQIIDLSVDLNSITTENRIFYTKWYDLEKREFIEDGSIGDIRFYTLLENTGNRKVFLQGRLDKPSTYIIDLGQINFEGIIDISNLDFQKEQLINKDKDKAQLYNGNAYAIQTFRYGKARYAKLFVNQIITQNFDGSKIGNPNIVKEPSFIDIGKTTSFQDNINYKYYISAYDGFGETIPVSTIQINSADTSNKKISFSFTLPYRAKGYFIYKEFNSKLYKLGPFYGEAENTNTYDDLGILGKEVNSPPKENTTIFSSYKSFNEIPLKLDFSYSFNGEADLKTFLFE